MSGANKILGEPLCRERKYLHKVEVRSLEVPVGENKGVVPRESNGHFFVCWQVSEDL